MRPISFELTRTISRSPAKICDEFRDLNRWPEFKGYGILPGIEWAVYETRTPEMVGSRIRVRNRDGSEHVEEIIRWDSQNGFLLTMDSFSPPLKHLATRFTEEWLLVNDGASTLVTRRFQLFARRPLTRPLLWLISLFFKRAIARHLADMGMETAK